MICPGNHIWLWIPEMPLGEIPEKENSKHDLVNWEELHLFAPIKGSIMFCLGIHSASMVILSAVERQEMVQGR